MVLRKEGSAGVSPATFGPARSGQDGRAPKKAGGRTGRHLRHNPVV